MIALPPLSHDKLNEASDLLKVLAHPTRLRLIFRLLEGECSVAEMVRGLGIQQPSLSQHLGELRQAALVSTRREHKTVYYTLTDDRTVDLMVALSDVFSDGPRQPSRTRLAPKQARHAGIAMFAVAGDAA